jgi:S-formylglutathione hydrolase FrmB
MNISLLHGWFPIAVQVIAAVAVGIAVIWRPPRWNLRWLPIAVLVGVGVAFSAHWWIEYEHLSSDPAPQLFWAWIALAGLSVAVLGVGWRGTRWWRRVTSALAILLCLLCVALQLNLWVGYLPTVDSAWRQVTGAPIGGQIEMATLKAMQVKGIQPIRGTLVSVKIPADGSGFAHRDELVYLPPAWYATNPPPALPVLMMIGAEFSQPADWPNVGALKVLDDFAAEHGGNAPVVVFVDHSGAFSNDTECVNGPRGNAADHLTKDVPPFMVSTFGVHSDAAHWGIAGWSTGGTCALTLAVKYPQLFSVFVDIDGEIGPNAGTRQQTIYRLFGGDTQTWAAFDPTTLMIDHGHYPATSGWFAVSEATPSVHRPGAADPGSARALQQPDVLDHAAVAQYMCELASKSGIDCAVVSHEAQHDFPSAVGMFAAALPWLAGKLGVPGAPAVSLPGARPS